MPKIKPKYKAGDLVENKYFVLSMATDGYPYEVLYDNRVYDLTLSTVVIELGEKYGTSDFLREVICKRQYGSPIAAVWLWCIVADGYKPHDLTRETVSRSPEYAFQYAKAIDRAPHPVTRQGIMNDPDERSRKYFAEKYDEYFLNKKQYG